MRLRHLFLSATTALLLGCAAQGPREAEEFHPFITATQRAADGLIQQLGKGAEPGTPLIIATLVDVNDLEKSTSLGRTISEQLSTHFTRSPFRVIEVKYRNSVYMKRSQGELVLTREIRDLAQSHKAGAVIAGTYAAGSEYVFVNLKAIRAEDNVITAGYNFALPLDNNTRALLK